MYVITGKDKGHPPFSLQSAGSDLDVTQRICRSLVMLPNTEQISLYEMDGLGVLSLVESWSHAQAVAAMPIAASQRTAKARKQVKTGQGTPETVQANSADFAGDSRFEGYCVKCREKREFAGHVELNAKGRRMAKGNCPVCGTKMNRMLPNA